VAALPDVLSAGSVWLQRCRLAHLDAVMAAIATSQPELARWLPWADPMPSVAAERDFLQEQERAFDADEDWGYVLTETHSGELVAGAGLHPKGRGVVEISYWVRSDRVLRGYATAAAGVLTVAAFEFLTDVERVVILLDTTPLLQGCRSAPASYTRSAPERALRSTAPRLSVCCRPELANEPLRTHAELMS
jgi:ribosomal-protein-serine acetyltransferase